jgi:hypothetical protein
MIPKLPVVNLMNNSLSSEDRGLRKTFPNNALTGRYSIGAVRALIYLVYLDLEFRVLRGKLA